MELIIAPLLSGLISAALAAFGCYVAITNRLTKVETLIESLKDETRKHNEVIERTYKLESDLATAWRRHDELGARVERLENVKIGGTE